MFVVTLEQFISTEGAGPLPPRPPCCRILSEQDPAPLRLGLGPVRLDPVRPLLMITVSPTIKQVGICAVKR